MSLESTLVNCANRLESFKKQLVVATLGGLPVDGILENLEELRDEIEKLKDEQEKLHSGDTALGFGHHGDGADLPTAQD